MKKPIIILCMLTIICVLSSCSSVNNSKKDNPADDYYEYPMNGIETSIDVDDAGNLYYISEDNQKESNNTKQESSDSISAKALEMTIRSVNSKGKELASYHIDGAIDCLDIENGKAYYIVTNMIDEVKKVNEISFYEYSFDKKSSKKLYQLKNTVSINKIEVVGQYIYYLGINSKKAGKQSTAAMNDNYYYSGEVMSRIDTTSGSISEMPVEFPVSFTKAPKDKLMIYAYDPDKGYYFTEYNCTTDKMSKKEFCNLGSITQFTVYNKKNIIFNTTNTSIPTLCAYTIGSENKVIDLMPNVGVGSIVCKGKYTYYINGMNSNKVERIDTPSYMRGNKTIHMISSLQSAYTPFGCGYTLQREYPTEESFSLSLLSQDPSFDIGLMSSRQEISENIRDKGSFYPLNKVDGVQKYLDSLFPYIKKAATTEDGSIWMLPIAVDIPSIIYNKERCSKYNMDLSQPIDFDTFINSLKIIRQNEELKNTYIASNFILTEDVLYQYLRSYQNFQTDQFNQLAPVLKSEVNYLRDDSVKDSAPVVSEMLNKGDTNNFLFDLEYSFDSEIRKSLNNAVRISELPHVTDKKKNMATCLYLCVNPASSNLKETLYYVSSLSKYLSSQQDSMMFKDRSRYPDKHAYQDLYDIYSNGDITFTLPNELFMSDYEKYLQGEMDLSALIKEADRKLDVFRKE